MKKGLTVATIVLALLSFAFSPVNRQCALTFITESLPDFTLGVPVNFQLEVCCGAAPYKFKLVQGALPKGLHLNQNGKMTGKPTEEADTTIFVQLTDSAKCSLTQAFQVRVVAP
jgi:hypothetical protein